MHHNMSLASVNLANFMATKKDSLYQVVAGFVVEQGVES